MVKAIALQDLLHTKIADEHLDESQVEYQSYNKLRTSQNSAQEHIRTLRNAEDDQLVVHDGMPYQHALYYKTVLLASQRNTARARIRSELNQHLAACQYHAGDIANQLPYELDPVLCKKCDELEATHTEMNQLYADWLQSIQ